MRYVILLILGLAFSCGVSLSNVALIDEESGIALKMMGPMNPVEDGSLSLELVIENVNEHYSIKVSKEDGTEVCTQEFTAIDHEHVKCNYDKNILHHGDNAFYISVSSIDSEKVVLSTMSHFFYEGYNVCGIDVTDAVTTLIENKEIILAAGGIALAANTISKLASVAKLRGGNKRLNELTAVTLTSTDKDQSVVEIRQEPQQQPPPPPPPTAPAVQPPVINPQSESTALVRPPPLSTRVVPVRPTNTKTSTRQITAFTVLRTAGLVIGVLAGGSKVMAAVRRSNEVSYNRNRFNRWMLELQPRARSNSNRPTPPPAFADDDQQVVVPSFSLGISNSHRPEEQESEKEPARRHSHSHTTVGHHDQNQQQQERQQQRERDRFLELAAFLNCRFLRRRR